MVTSVKPKQPASPLRPHPHLCEINTWAWLEELSAQQKRLIKIADVPDEEWDKLAALGFDVIWLMGIWQPVRRRGKSRRRCRAWRRVSRVRCRGGNRRTWSVRRIPLRPYVPDARIGTWDDLDAVRKKLRARGVSLFFDFVGNHTARDHPLGSRASRSITCRDSRAISRKTR